MTATGEIRMPEDHAKPVPAGEIVGLNLRNVNCCNLVPGRIVCDPNDEPCQFARMFIAQIIVISHPGSIKPGFIPTIYCNI